MVSQAPAREFPIEWPTPEDAEKSWIWDGMHCPRPLTPLAQDFFLSMTSIQAKLEATTTGRTPTRPLFLKGFAYTSFDLSNPDPDEMPGGEAQERNAERAPRMRQLWTGTYLPRVKRARRFIVETDTSGMTTDEMLAHLARCLERASHAFSATLEAAGPMFEGVSKLYELCEDKLGAAGLALAGASVQGYDNESFLSDRAVSDVAAVARRLGLADLIVKTPAAEVPAAVRAAKGGTQFKGALDAYLDHYGWRTPTWFELVDGCWREEPAEAIKLVQRALSGESEDPREVQAGVVRKRRAALRKLRRHFSRPDERAAFETAWRTARNFVPVSEGRALWQLSLSGFLRVPALAAGARLVKDGVLTAADDIFYLRSEELTSDRSGWAGIVAERRPERARYMAVVPPMMIGRPPALPPVTPGAAPGSPPRLPLGARLVSGFGGERSMDERILKGHPASPGVVQGRARVVETMDQAGKVEDGDILVCRFTTPSWTPLFSRVAAIVADSGGILSHCAILSREYGIPCVPGVRVGTRRIRDGMLLTVDGSQGIVRLDDAG